MLARLHPPTVPCASWRSVVRTLITLGITLALGACVIPRMIDTDVQTFGGSSPAVPGASYRFERLPSQPSANQEAMEAMAQAALQSVGLTLAVSQPRYLVQVHSEVVQFQPVSTRVPASVPPYVDRHGTPLNAPLVFMMQPTWYGHIVHLVLRDAHSGELAYETRARFDGPWSDSATLWPVILQAALRDYPQAPTGVRKITIELPRNGTPTP